MYSGTEFILIASREACTLNRNLLSCRNEYGVLVFRQLTLNEYPLEVKQKHSIF